MRRPIHLFKFLWLPIFIWVGLAYGAELNGAPLQVVRCTGESAYSVPFTDLLAIQFIQPATIAFNELTNSSKDTGPRWEPAATQKFLHKHTPTNFAATFITQDNNRCLFVALILYPFHEFW